MNRTALSLRMLQILKARGLVKKCELAELLETNQRNIIELKKELEVAGYDIETFNGKAGGYRLNANALLPVCALSPEQQTALQDAYTYLRSLDNYIFNKDFELAFEKVLAGNVTTTLNDDFTIIGSHMVMPIAELRTNYQMIKTAISDRTRIVIGYRPKNQTINNWIIHPYDLFQYKDMWYLVGYRQKQDGVCDKVITLKLNRIVSIKQTTIKYHFPEDFNIKEYVSKFGMVIGKKQEIVLKINKRYYLSEYIYGEDQQITSVDDETVILSVVMQGEISIKQLVLSLGSDCEVIKPKWLRDYMIDVGEKLNQIYKKRA